MRINADVRHIGSAGGKTFLPLRVDQSGTIHLRHIDHVDAIRSVNGDPAAARYKTDDLIPGHRRTAFGKTDCHIIHTLDNDAALALFLPVVLALDPILEALQDLLLDNGLAVIFFVKILQFVNDLTFLDGAVPYGGQKRIPVTESVFFKDRLLIIRLHQVGQH